MELQAEIYHNQTQTLLYFILTQGQTNKTKGIIYKWKNHEDYPDVAIDYIILDSKVNEKKSKVKQAEFAYEQAVEERKLRILEAYNSVLEHLTLLKVKSEAVALYNAQMKISEADFVKGKISIIDLSLERGRRTTAVVNFQETKAALHNSITLLEMLTGVKIIK